VAAPLSTPGPRHDNSGAASAPPRDILGGLDSFDFTEAPSQTNVVSEPGAPPNKGYVQPPLTAIHTPTPSYTSPPLTAIHKPATVTTSTAGPTATASPAPTLPAGMAVALKGM
jgi:hypothetical protein